MKQRISFIVLSIVLVLSVFNCNAFADDNRIKVGYYLTSQYQEVNENNEYSGYAYEYYQEIAQYTGWDYKFVIAPFSECVKMLENGEIDLMSGLDMTSDRAKYLDYSDFTFGATQLGIYTLEENDSLVFEDFDAFNNLKIGVLQGDKQINSLYKYRERHHFTIEVQNFVSQQDMEKALLNKEVDAIFLSNESILKQVKLIGIIDSLPLYFASSKANPKMMEILNEALREIRNNNPFFESDLYKKYGYSGNIAAPTFTREELEYIRSNPKITVVYDPKWAPIEYYNEETDSYCGISHGIIEQVEKYSGLKFEYIKPDNFSDAIKTISNGKADIIGSISRDYNWADRNNVYLSSSYLEAPVVILTKQGITLDKIKTIALPKGYYTTYCVEKQKDLGKFIYYSTVEECLKAVETGVADATYVNIYVASYFLSDTRVRDVYSAGVSEISENLSLGISNDANPHLLSIINKALLCIQTEEKKHIILENTIYNEDVTFEKFMETHKKEAVGATTMVAILAVLIIMGILVSHRRKNRKIKDALSQTNICNERFKMALLQVKSQIFEYDIKTKKLFVIDKDNGEGIEITDNLAQLPEEVLRYGIIDEEFMQTYRLMFEHITPSEKTSSEILRLGIENGDDKWRRLTFATVFDENVPLRIIGVAENITQEKRIENRFYMEQQYRTAMLSEALGVLSVNVTKSKVISLVIGERELISKADNLTFDIGIFAANGLYIYPDDLEKTKEIYKGKNLTEAFESGRRELSMSLRCRTDANEYRWINSTANLLTDPDTGDILCFIYAKDIDEQKKIEFQLKHKAERDSLTGLYNRVTAESFITQLLKEYEGTRSAFLMLDLDDFKNINDMHGHYAGDFVLRSIADVLKASFRSDDIVARMGGDEFCVFIKRIPSEKFLLRKAEEIAEGFEHIAYKGIEENTISMSIGIAICPEHGNTFIQLYEKADAALYQAKALGKNRASIYNEEETL
ncbi:MAG: transporter substrate-binding domain-containing protein [Anaerotignaceae bacterium]